MIFFQNLKGGEEGDTTLWLNAAELKGLGQEI
jgi:hypothetical protein